RDESVRHAAIHSVSLWRDQAAIGSLVSTLGSPSAQLERVAAEALGRLGDRSAVSALLAASAKPCDRVLEHSLIYALIEIGDVAGTSMGLNAGSAREKRAALIALDQMDDGHLKVETIAPLLASTDPLLRQTAVWISGHHPQWGGAL